MSDTENQRTTAVAPRFKRSHLWEPAIVNPLNLKSYTIPILNLNDPYSRAFHLSWLGFFVAFLSWFAFPPLIPEAIRSDLSLSNAEVGNSNIIALLSTLVIRVIVGPLIDRYGPRKVMAALLVLGAIPSGLAGTAKDANTLYVLRFFIGILGATFVPCQAWTSAFFDKNCVGTANALVGGWGNMGGGATFAVMVALFQSLTVDRGLSSHSAWRAAFAIVPVPILLTTALLTMVFGQDHPAGTWDQRHNIPAAALAADEFVESESTSTDKTPEKDSKKDSTDHGMVRVVSVSEKEKEMGSVVQPPIRSTVDVAVNEHLTLASTAKILLNPLTWLPAFAYLTTFGIELVIDSKMADVLYHLFATKRQGFDQTTAGYYTSIFGFLNLVTRPLGGYLGDVVYRYYGTRGKKIWTLACGLIMGASMIGGGFYLQNTRVNGDSELPTLMGVFGVAMIFSELGNGANFALVPHCNPYNNGVMSGIVGSFGNLGGIVFAIIFRFQTQAGQAFWIMGVLCVALNAILLPVRVPKY
ncbi:unnamed protein product [Cyclocybe aegerita]|uniref:Nitrate/nitrite transporter n=1 Tax=Cyclocybe aegerita TaxID=1973307 RepID=A0A8S0VZN7_CYCAE|nr:unnamed protein product [Cyclocybe aegerita]